MNEAKAITTTNTAKTIYGRALAANGIVFLTTNSFVFPQNK